MKIVYAGPNHPAYRTDRGRRSALTALGCLVGCEAGAREQQAMSTVDTIAGRWWGRVWLRPDPVKFGMVHEGGRWAKGSLPKL